VRYCLFYAVAAIFAVACVPAQTLPRPGGNVPIPPIGDPRGIDPVVFREGVLVPCGPDPMVVTTTDTTTYEEEYCRTLKCTLRGAINSANLCPDNSSVTISLPEDGRFSFIDFSIPTRADRARDDFSVEERRESVLPIIQPQRNIIIEGNNATIERRDAERWNLFRARAIKTRNGSLTIRNLTFRDFKTGFAFAPGEDPYNRFKDGGVLHLGGNATLENVNFFNNGFNDRNSGEPLIKGGAIYMSGGDLTIRDALFFDNDAHFGAAIYVRRLSSSAAILITDSLFLNNNMNAVWVDTLHDGDVLIDGVRFLGDRRLEGAPGRVPSAIRFGALSGGADVMISNSEFRNLPDLPIVVSSYTDLIINQSVFSGNGGVAGAAAFAGLGAAATFRSSVIENNAGHGVICKAGTNLIRFTGSIVRNNGGDGVANSIPDDGSDMGCEAMFERAVITGNGGRDCALGVDIDDEGGNRDSDGTCGFE